jgi:hypothetical protein
MKTGFEPGTMKFVIPVFYALGSLNILFLQSRQLFEIVAFPGVLLGDILGITDVMPFYEEAAFDFVVALAFYFVIGVLIDLIWGYFVKKNTQKKTPPERGLQNK